MAWADRARVPHALTTTQRGYGSKHQALRKQLLPKAYGTPCPHCGEPMLEGQKLDLDHTEDRAGYRGFSHSSCNRAAGTRKANARIKERMQHDQHSRDW